MSLRPRQPGMARLARAQGRMAPGGRRWSESPIPRPGHRRMLLAPGDPAAATYLSRANRNTAAGTVGVDLSTVPAAVGAATGDVLVALCLGNQTGWAAPTGWDTLAAGSVTSLDYAVYARTLTGSDAFTVGTPSLAPGWTPGSGGEGYGQVLIWGFTDTSGAPTATTPVESASTTSITLQPGTGLATPWNATGSLAVANASHSIDLDPVDLWTTAFAGSYGTPRRVYAVGFDPDTGPGAGTVTTSIACEAVSLALGWA